jgi:hypothetical protein
MKIHSNVHLAVNAMGLQSALALCAGTALLVMSSAAFAQVDPGVKLATPEKVTRVAPGDKGAHNPPAYKCEHNPPGFKGEQNSINFTRPQTGDTRMLLPAGKLAADGKALNTPQTDTTACPNAK